VHLERADVSDSSGQQADESPESVATTMLSSTSKSLDAEVVQLSDDVPSLQWDTADLTSALLHHDLHACEYMQGGPTKAGPQTHGHTYVKSKPFLISLLTIPRHVKYVATLPCNLSLMACFTDSNVSQGSVATYARCVGILNIQLTTNVPWNLTVKNF